MRALVEEHRTPAREFGSHEGTPPPPSRHLQAEEYDGTHKPPPTTARHEAQGALLQVGATATY